MHYIILISTDGVGGILRMAAFTPLKQAKLALQRFVEGGWAKDKMIRRIGAEEN